MDFIFLEDPTLNSKPMTKDINKMMCRYCVDLLQKKILISDSLLNFRWPLNLSINAP